MELSFSPQLVHISSQRSSGRILINSDFAHNVLALYIIPPQASEASWMMDPQFHTSGIHVHSVLETCSLCSTPQKTTGKEEKEKVLQ